MNAEDSQARAHRDDADVAAGEVRSEDAFDIEAAAAWLRGNVHPEVSAEGLQGQPQVRQFSGGASNLTYLLRYPDRDLILRRPPSGTKAKGAHNMRREHDIQRAIKPYFPAVPTMVAFCDDPAVIGTDFYVMQRVPGIILRKDLPPDLNLGPTEVRNLCTSVLDQLVALHQVDVEQAGLAELNRGPGYVQRQVQGWSTRYRNARTHGVRTGTGSFEKVMRWLEENQPQDSSSCLIHNDFRLDNVVLDPSDPSKINAVLDWEMATVGDPLMDLGGALAYWVQADDDRVMKGSRRQPTTARGMLTRAEIWRYYGEKSGKVIEPQAQLFYEVFGLFRLAAIGQQIYYRYAQGQTHNPAFKQFRLLVIYLEWRCRHLIRQGGKLS